MDGLSPLQVCINLIKRCLCESCLPSARFIIKVSEWEKKKRRGGKSDRPSRFTNLWSSFHEWGGPRCSSCWTHGYLFAKGALVVCPCWLVALRPCAPPPTQPHIHTTNCTFTLFLSLMLPHRPTIPLILPHSQIPLNVFTQRENKPPYIPTPDSQISPLVRVWFRALVWSSEGRKRARQPTCNCKLICLENVYLDTQCHTFLGCCCFSPCSHRMVPLWARVQHFPGPSASLSSKCFIIPRAREMALTWASKKSMWRSSPLYLFV